MANTFQALTRYGKTLHETAEDMRVRAGSTGYRTFCWRLVQAVESEESGSKQAWRIKTRDMRRCRRCELEVERRAEHG